MDRTRTRLGGRPRARTSQHNQTHTPPKPAKTMEPPPCTPSGQAVAAGGRREAAALNQERDQPDGTVGGDREGREGGREEEE